MIKNNSNLQGIGSIHCRNFEAAANTSLIFFIEEEISTDP